MMGARPIKAGELVVLPRREQDRAGELGATVPVRPERPFASSSEASVDLSNVVPFMRPRAQGDTRSAPEVALPADVTHRPASPVRERVRLAALAALSVLVHGGLLLAFVGREPDPLASIGVQVISVEIVVGATAPAGIAPTPNENEVQAADSSATPHPTDPARETEQRATAQPQAVPLAQQEAAPEQPSELQPEEAQPAQQQEPKPAVAMVESPKPDTPTAQPRPVPPKANISLLPQPERKAVKPPAPKQVQRKAEPKQLVAARPAPATAPEPTRIAGPTKERASERARPAAPTRAANNVGPGRSDNDTNYRGIVAAHLARYKQYPADARSRGEHGTAAVAFSLDGGGRVTSVRLARSSGVASIDQEVQSMVHRASPFPAPPNGRPQAFSVPVNFSLR